MAPIKNCCFPDCSVQVDPPHICCIHHWHLLPPRIQSEAQLRIRAWKSPGDARSFVADWVRLNRKATRNDPINV